MAKSTTDDKRLLAVESEEKAALRENEKLYGDMVKQSDQYYKAQIDASKQWADKQTQLQNQQTDFAIEKIEQQKDQAEKDYTKEQSASYVDWQKQSGQYGVNAEQTTASGLANTGYAESSQVSMYNTYQNRVASARESYNRAILNYDNAIKDARLQNNSILAEIAYNSLQQQLELSLAGFQYKNQLLTTMADKKAQITDRYHAQYQDVLDQINKENALEEEIRQYNQNYALDLKKYNESVRQYNEEMALKKAQLEEEKRQYNTALAASKSSGGGGGSSSGGRVSKSKSSSKSTGANIYALTSVGDKVKPGNKYAVETEYYKGKSNPDAKKYGVFSNGYQPKGISGHGKLSKSGKTVQISTQTLSGKKQTLVQNVWKAEDGTSWYWEGRQNKYIQIKTGARATR